MTPAEKLQYLESLAARKPHARLSSAFDKLRVYETADNLKRAMEPKFKVLQAAQELRELARRKEVA
jgi:hypothetical protein